MAGLAPDAVVVVATVRALKHHGGVPKAELGSGEPRRPGEGPAQPAGAMWTTCTNVYGLPCVVAINRFPHRYRGGAGPDRRAAAASWASTCALSEVWAKGGEGGVELAEEVVPPRARSRASFHFALHLSHRAAHRGEDRPPSPREIYGADGRGASPPAAQKQLKAASRHWAAATCPSAWPRPSTPSRTTPSCWARPTGFTITVRELQALRRRRLCGGPHRGHHDHARPAQSPRRRED